MAMGLDAPLHTHTWLSSGGPPHTNQWKIKLVPVRWKASVASAGPLNDPFLGIVTSWRWLGEGISTKPPNLKGRGSGCPWKQCCWGDGKGHILERWRWLLGSGAHLGRVSWWVFSPGPLPLQGLLQRRRSFSSSFKSRSATSRQSSQTRSTTPVIHAQKRLPCPPVYNLSSLVSRKGVKSKNFTFATGQLCVLE